MTIEHILIMIGILLPLYQLLKLRKRNMPSQSWQRRRNWRNKK